MKLHGSLIENLRGAIASARRLRGQRVYPETLEFWGELLDVARRVLSTIIDTESPVILSLAGELESEIQGFLHDTPVGSGGRQPFDTDLRRASQG